MSRSISLTIQMNTPCGEDWSGMEPTEQGRFCNNCQKPVVNFVDLTNQEILQYFLEHPFPVCGRMQTSQRDQNFVNSTSKINRNLSPVAATLLTLATITTEAAHPSPPRVNMIQVQLPNNNQTPATPADSVLISGTVKDKHGAPIENAEIVFDQYKILSDKNGSFQFTLHAELTKPTVIQFSYPKLERQVRSYHPLMGSTSYDIVLSEPYIPEYVIMGGIQPSFSLPLPDSLSTLSFQSSNKLDLKTKTLLVNLANFMKDNPNERITLQSYYNSSKQKAVKLCNLIKNFLEIEEGINIDRIQIANPQLEKKIKSEVVIDFMEREE
ncbi:MAG TPA: carboxypeptidase-like regulatory domain-containing protein [Niastella sp.]